jgi:preprotein translocase subunit SecE
MRYFFYPFTESGLHILTAPNKQTTKQTNKQKKKGKNIRNLFAESAEEDSKIITKQRNKNKNNTHY